MLNNPKQFTQTKKNNRDSEIIEAKWKKALFTVETNALVNLSVVKRKKNVFAYFVNLKRYVNKCVGFFSRALPFIKWNFYDKTSYTRKRDHFTKTKKFQLVKIANNISTSTLLFTLKFNENRKLDLFIWNCVSILTYGDFFFIYFHCAVKKFVVSIETVFSKENAQHMHIQRSIQSN